jgi:transposase
MTRMTRCRCEPHTGGMNNPTDPEVAGREASQRSTAKYKFEIVAEYEQFDKVGQAALLRRNGLYSR